MIDETDRKKLILGTYFLFFSYFLCFLLKISSTKCHILYSCVYWQIEYEVIISVTPQDVSSRF